MKSEFGKGLCYCLGLFLGHQDAYLIPKSFGKFDERNAWQWFCGATDHLYELQVEQAPKHLQKRLIEFRDECFFHRNALQAKVLDVKQAIQKAKDILRLIDKANGIETEKGRWE